MSDLAAARQALAVRGLMALDRSVWTDIAPRLTCHEAEAFVEFLALTGDLELVAAFKECHAEGDDDEADQHHGGWLDETPPPAPDVEPPYGPDIWTNFLPTEGTPP